MLPTQKTQKVTQFSRQNTLIYGAPKVGKSSFAAEIPNALFLTTEEGYSNLEIYNVRIKKWEDVYDVGKALRDEKHEFKTVVVDIVDLFFKHCESYVMKKFDAIHPSDLPFGKGYSLVKDEFTKTVNAINQMGYGMVFISHSKEREMATKTAKWSYMDCSMSASPGAIICGMADFIFYFYIDAEGKRWIRTKPTKYINAGDRTGKLPELIPLSYAELIKAFKENVK